MIGRVVLALLIGLAVAGCEKPKVEDGVQRAKNTWTDQGAAADEATVRALLGVRLPDRAALDAHVRDLYDRDSSKFRHYLSVEELNARFAPREADVAAVRGWAEGKGLRVARVSDNRLLVEVTGTAGVFNTAFATRLHRYTHEDNYDAYGTPDGLTLPEDVPALMTVASLDTLVDPSRAQEADDEVDQPKTPPSSALAPVDIAMAYGLDALHDRGERGKGARIGVVTGGGFRPSSVRAFWKAFGVSRPDAEVRELMDTPPSRTFEATFDIEWAGVLAPEAEVLVFQGADPRTTSLLFAFNAAATSGAVDVVTDSFAHREDTEPLPTRELYDISAELGAAIGTTVVAASGDSAKPDIPATCPFVTGVGGTKLTIKDGAVESEEAWERSGAGPSSFPAPSWQKGLPGVGAERAIPDVAVNAGVAYLSRFSEEWRDTAGTSVSAPVFAAVIAVINGARRAAGDPAVGYLNSIVYGDAAVQRAFRDVTTGGTSEHAAGAGWDMPTGWGAPNAARLRDAL